MFLGFGFVLRGAKATSPLIKQLNQPIGLQYFDEIEHQGVADAAGLKRGDFLLAVNGCDVRQMTHEAVVQLIRQFGDKVTMTVATPIPQKKQLQSILKKPSDEKKKGEIKTEEQSDDSMTRSMPGAPDAQEFNNAINKFSTLPRNSPGNSTMSLSRIDSRSASRGRAPPAPPKRDPTTTLSMGRARARSVQANSGHSSQSSR